MGQTHAYLQHTGPSAAEVVAHFRPALRALAETTETLRTRTREELQARNIPGAFNVLHRGGSPPIMKNTHILQWLTDNYSKWMDDDELLATTREFWALAACAGFFMPDRTSLLTCDESARIDRIMGPHGFLARAQELSRSSEPLQTLLFANLGNAHWIVVVVNPAQRKVRLYDSLITGHGQSVPKDVRDGVAASTGWNAPANKAYFLERYLTVSVPDATHRTPQSFTWTYEPTVEQKDSKTCGFWSIVTAMWLFAQALKTDDPTPNLPADPVRVTAAWARAVCAWWMVHFASPRTFGLPELPPRPQRRAQTPGPSRRRNVIEVPED